jgi:hypothetical protein
MKRSVSTGPRRVTPTMLSSVVVDNAGYADAGSFEEMPPDVFDAQMRTNVYDVVNVTRAALPVRRRRRSGRRAHGDPRKSAQAIVAPAELDEPPLRVPFGSDTVKILRAAAEKDIATIDRRRSLSESTDADDAVPFDLATLPGL